MGAGFALAPMLAERSRAARTEAVLATALAGLERRWAASGAVSDPTDPAAAVDPAVIGELVALGAWQAGPPPRLVDGWTRPIAASLGSGSGWVLELRSAGRDGRLGSPDDHVLRR